MQVPTHRQTCRIHIPNGKSAAALPWESAGSLCTGITKMSGCQDEWMRYKLTIVIQLFRRWSILLIRWAQTDSLVQDFTCSLFQPFHHWVGWSVFRHFINEIYRKREILSATRMFHSNSYLQVNLIYPYFRIKVLWKKSHRLNVLKDFYNTNFL